MGKDDAQPTLRAGGNTAEKYAKELAEKADQLQSKAQKTSGQEEKQGPAGGYDSTQLPSHAPGWTIRITFHCAENLPFADIGTLSSDPYIIATLKTDLPKRHKQDPDLVLRTPTIHKNTNPHWNTQWVIAHVPASGFAMKCRVYDEDANDHDDRLGNAHVNISGIGDDYKGFKEQQFEIKKRMASKRAYTFRAISALLHNTKMNGSLIISVENLGRSPGDGCRAYTIAPLTWSKHHSPLIGRIAGVKDVDIDTVGDEKQVQRYNFQAIQMQLRGPVPVELYHRYVEFKPFVAGMFTDHSLRGRILNRALHHQHARIYNYDTSTVYGVFESPTDKVTRQFLEFVHYDQGGRIFTYVITLDGQWRFTETGKEFGIDMLSKHTMHSDVSIYIAFSGEFFIRRLKHPHPRSEEPPADHEPLPPDVADRENQNSTTESDRPKSKKSISSHNRSKSSGTTTSTKSTPFDKDPSSYELIIDNDSGTYRPNADLLPLLKHFMEVNLPGLHVVTLDCQKDEEKMTKLKTEQRESKKQGGNQIMYMQNSSMSSFSSSDEEELNARAEGRSYQHGYKRNVKKMRHPGDHAGERSQEQKQEKRRSLYTDNHTSAASAPVDEDRQKVKEPNLDDVYAEKIDKEKYQPTANGQQLMHTNKEVEGMVDGETEHAKAANADQAKTGEYGEPQKGDNRPAGGIAVEKVVIV